MDIAIIGTGGHSKVIQDIVRSGGEYRIKAFLDDKFGQLAFENGLYTGPVSSASKLRELVGSINFVVAIGNNEIRKAIVTRLGLSDEHYISLVHHTAVISPSASIGQGTVIMANAVVNADAVIGSHAIINTGAVMEHDCVVESFSHAAPHAALTGSVTVQEGGFIGASATVIPGITIGEWAKVGAGAAVIHDIPPHSTAVGIPARIIKDNLGFEKEDSYAKNATI